MFKIRIAMRLGRRLVPFAAVPWLLTLARLRRPLPVIWGCVIWDLAFAVALACLVATAAASARATPAPPAPASRAIGR